MRGSPITVKDPTTGKSTEYPTKGKFCEAAKMNFSTFDKSIDRGMTPWEILHRPRGVTLTNPISGEVTEYPTQTAFCKKNSILTSTYLKYIREGLSPWEILHRPRREHKIEVVDPDSGTVSEYASFRKFSKAAKISYDTYFKYIDRGMTPWEILHRHRLNLKSFSHDGYVYEYRCLPELAHLFNIPADTFARRVNKLGWTLAEACGLDPRTTITGNELNFVHKGKKYEFVSMTAAGQKFGISGQSIKERLDRGWTKQQACGLDPRTTGNEFNFVHKGKKYEFKSMAGAERKFGIRNGIIKMRMALGWTKQQACGLVPRTTGNEFTFVHKGKKYEFVSLMAAERKFGIRNGIIGYRLSRGWTKQQACGLDPYTTVNEFTFVHKGKKYEFESMSAAERKFGIRNGIIHRRLARRWTIQQACGLDPIPSNPGIIYGIVDDTGVVYVGQSKTPLGNTKAQDLDFIRARYQGECTDINNNRPILKHIRKCGGINKVSIIIITKTSKRDKLNELEVKYILEYDTLENGFNARDGGGVNANAHGSSVESICPKGDEYPTKREMCEAYGCKYDTYMSRIRRGIDAATALTGN